MTRNEQQAALALISHMGARVDLYAGEARRVLRHRLTLAVVVASVFLVSLAAGFSGFEFQMLLAVNWGGLIVGMFVVQGWAYAMERRSRRKKRPVRLSLAFVTLVLTLVSFFASFLISVCFFGLERPSAMWIAGAAMVHVFAGQIGLVPFIRYVLPLILTDIRRNPVVDAPHPDWSPGVILEMLCTDRAFVRPREMWSLASHHLSLVFYMAMALFLILLHSSHLLGNGPSEMLVPGYVIGVFAGLVLVMSFLLFADWLAPRIGRVIHVRCAPIIFMGTGVGVFVMEWVKHLQIGGPVPAWDKPFPMTIFYYVLVELMAAFAFVSIFPIVLSNVRGQVVERMADTFRSPQPKSSDQIVSAPVADDGGAPEAATKPAAPPPIPPAPRRQGASLTVGGKPFQLRDLVQIVAEGNYVRVHTRRERFLLPGPFAAAVAALPPDAGLMVHRSSWVAGWAVTGQRRDGRDLFLTLANGTEAKVALPRHKAVLAWLAEAAAQSRAGD